MARAIPPQYRFQGSTDSVAQEIKRRAMVAERSNPIINGPYSGATVAWFTGGGSLTQQWDYFNQPAGTFTFSSGSPQLNSSNNVVGAAAYSFPTAGGLSAFTPWNVSTDPRFYFGPNFTSVRFKTSAAVFEMHGSWVDANNNYSVIVDNQYATTQPGGLNPPANGGISVTFSAGRKDRIIEIAGSGAWQFRGIYTASILDDVSSAGAVGPMWVFDGDSFTQGGGLNTPVDPEAPWYVQASRMLGIDNSYPTAVSSTGYISTGNPFPGGVLTTLRGRLQNGVGWSLLQGIPDAIICAAGYNDMTYLIAGNITQAQLVAECVLTWKAYRSVYPNAIIIVLGPWSGGRGPDAQTIAAELAMQAALVALGDSRMFFIPVSTAKPKPWQYGTGRTNNLTGDGNSDWVTGPLVPHPIDAGHAHLAQRFVASVRPILYSL